MLSSACWERMPSSFSLKVLKMEGYDNVFAYVGEK